MGRTYIKTITREVKQSFGRFFAIFSIVALGVGFLAGLLSATPSMELSVDKYYKDNNMTDVFIKAPLGLTDRDLEHVAKIKEVDYIMPAYVTDAIMESDNKEVYTSRVYGLALDRLNNNEFINKLQLIEGRLPNNNNECLVEASGDYIADIELGTSLTILEDGEDEIEDIYKSTQYTVVGIVSNPFYFSMEREPSSKGDGSISAIVYVNEGSYNLDVYTDLYIRAKNPNSFESFTDEYGKYIYDLVKETKDLGVVRAQLRYDEILKEAKDKLDEAKEEYKEEKEKAYKELEEAKEELEEAKVEITKAEEDLKSGKNKLANSKSKLSKERANYKNQIRDQESELDKAASELAKARQELEGAREFISQEEYDMGINGILAKEGELQAGREQLQIKKREAEAEFRDGENQIRQGQADIDKGESDLKEAKKDLEEGEKDYQEGKKEAEEELARAEKEILDAEEDIKDIKYSKWYVLDRDSNISYASFSANVTKVGAIAKVFPVFFLLVAALVALTTMTRMVEEERTQIGTLKALGYTKTVIMSKYIIYCGIASLLGSIIGLFAGFKILPNVIWGAYENMYILPQLYVEVSWSLALGLSLLAIASTMLATISAASNVLKEKPATLMLPRAPKAGKRIFLERIGFIWNRMKFTHKATARNLIRYKKHFFMTVIGISGCTALIVAGFGIKDSIGDIANTQFNEIFKYDLMIVKDDSNKEDKVLEDFLNNPNKSKGYLELSREDGKIESKEDSYDVTIMVAKDTDRLKEFIELRDRENQNNLLFDESSVIIAEKLAEELDVKLGDSVTLLNSEDENADFKITGITENYVGSYIYISNRLYNKSFKEELLYDNLLVKSPVSELSKQENLLNEILSSDIVISAEFKSQTKETYDNLLGSINYIVIVLILAAGGLAIIVLYNLTNINIEERRKELATLKVLGFHEKEVAAYIYRETTILSIIGTIVGLGLGKLLHSFVIMKGESVDLMFGRSISTFSYIISAVITIIFTLIVDLIMYKKLKNIEMVDSMKAID
ncbi:MAG: FtsX-like permease family protein [Epulopiscium sp.]|mgnify:CR=1 FL=1|nr:FtsX-like permease family protein [Candidatus Epulonipiscium sp.]